MDGLGLKRQLRLGLTGGMASGKSTAAAWLKARGARLIDTDAIARQLTAPGGRALGAIAAQLGTQLVSADGLDRAALRDLVFAKPDARRTLEALLHPLILREAEMQAECAGCEPVLVFDVPLLVESRHWRARVDRVLLIDCDEAVQTQRAMARGWTATQVDGALAAQASRAQRRQAADAVIDNSAIGLERLHAALDGVLAHWGVRYPPPYERIGPLIATVPRVLLYEFPFNEYVRTLLRLGHLFHRLGELMARDSALDHHFALVTLFELLDVAQRTDLKGELMKELERQRAQVNAYRGNPAVSQAALDDICNRIDGAFRDLNTLQGKPGAALASHEMLAALRSRIAIPGGTCEFDLPGYHAWQQHPVPMRHQDLRQWVASLLPLAEAVKLLLMLLRDTGVPHRVAAQSGQFQQSLNASKTPQLLRLRIDASLGLIPEISAHRLMVSVRLLRADAEGRLKPAVGEDVPLEIRLCA